MDTVDNPAVEPTQEMSFQDRFAKAAGLLEDSPEEPKEAPETEQAEETEEVTDETEEVTEEATEEPEVEDQAAFTIFDKETGQEIRVSKEEAKNGYLRHQDYTKKTQVVAEQRKAAETERQQFSQQVQQYSGYLGGLVQQLQAVVQADQQVDWNALRQEDPVEYSIRKADALERQTLYQQAAQAQHAMQQQAEAEQQQKMNHIRKAEYEKLLEKVPEWKDPAKRSADNERLMSYAIENGYTQEEYGNAIDHRAFMLLRKAMLYDNAQKSKAEVSKKVVNLPKVVKPGPQKTPNAQTGQKELVNKLRKTGDAKFAVDYFKNAFGDS